ncbi:MULTISPECIES: N-formylglutamate amidohydrolase [Hyphobacterium]|uniref:N-formylglutamate amidohydrolase n=1 Tax=Hyphobacterium vulgare TaxID=1736751 RepID=A0ABV6ZVI5_9PROT
MNDMVVKLTSATRTARPPGTAALPPVEVLRPLRGTAPVIIASPHSGRAYPERFLEQSALSLDLLRRSEDAFMDELYASAPAAGLTLVLATFPRVYVDPNRSADELDPLLTGDRTDPLTPIRSPRAHAGLGVVPRLGADGLSIHSGLLDRAEIAHRIALCHTPYHAALEAEIARTVDRHGFAILIDAHSMPSISAPGIDAVIGDRHGVSCAPRITDAIESALQAQGLRTRRNTPYAGGYTTERYGQPDHARHAVQIELNRALYLDEGRVARSGTFDSLRWRIDAFLASIVAIDWVEKLA